jgi:3-phenylpropionate/cinnamic acid dioxygenase small subunit
MVLSVSDFLYYEAALLDARQLTEWLGLFTDDALYWVPARPDADPTRDVSLVYDDRARLSERVRRLTSGFAHAQRPPSRTCHVVGNVRVLGEREGALEVASNLVVAEVRRSQQAVYAGQVTHWLVPASDGWRIRRKIIYLVNSDIALGNLTFIL